MNAFTLPSPCEIPNGAYCVWQIPSLNISVPVYKSTSQKVVDAENSAAMQYGASCYVISDHAGSKDGNGFWMMQNVRLDDAAFLIRKDRTERYVCYAVLRVEHRSTRLVINGKTVNAYSSKDIICRSCVDMSGKENYVAMFRYAGIMP